MANQYTGSLENLSVRIFHKPLFEVLRSFSEQGLTIDTAARRFKVSESCICRWLKRFNLSLERKPLNKTPIKEQPFDEFQNLLCRQWRSI